jgi:hypothetical protein
MVSENGVSQKMVSDHFSQASEPAKNDLTPFFLGNLAGRQGSR